MSFITEIFNDIKKCCPCLTFLQHSQNDSNLQQPLVQMQQLTTHKKPSTHSRNPSRKRTASCNDALSAHQQNNIHQFQNIQQNMIQSLGSTKRKKQPELPQQTTSKEQQLKQKPLIIKRIQSGNLVERQRKSGSQSSFRTIKSTASRPISRRNFKILRQSSSFYAKHRAAQDQFYSVNHSQNSSIHGEQVHRIVAFKFAQNSQNNKDGIDMMNVWMKKQYEPYPYKMYKPVISEITKMKLQTKDVFDSMVHRLQDYYTFYFEDQKFMQTSQQNHNSEQKNQFTGLEPGTFTYQEANHQMICSITKTDFTKSFDYQKTCKFMSLIIIPHCSLPPLAFLQWFNKLQVQSNLHAFNKIEYIQNSQRVDDKIKMQYPLVRVQQFNQNLLGKQTYLLARQIEVVKFENQQDKQTLLQICFQSIDEEKCFERVIRVTAEGAEGSRAEIYIQSSQNVLKRPNNEHMSISKKTQQDKNSQYKYFQQRWKKFQQKLNKDHIINKKVGQVFTS